MKQKLMQLEVLCNSKVKLVPLQQEHLQKLIDVGTDQRIWKFANEYRAENKAGFIDYFNDAIQRQQLTTQFPYCIQTTSGQVAGMSRFYDINDKHRSVLIGYTWFGVEFQRTGINRNTKFLMLNYAFSELGAERIQFNIDEQNTTSREAIKKIGARFEGSLRSHMEVIDTSITDRVAFRRRNTTIYSIIKSDWPDIKSTVFNDYK